VTRIKKVDGFYTCFPGCDSFKVKLAFLKHLLSDHAEELKRQGYPTEYLVNQISMETASTDRRKQRRASQRRLSREKARAADTNADNERTVAAIGDGF
jgi:hypothetical protein